MSHCVLKIRMEDSLNGLFLCTALVFSYVWVTPQSESLSNAHAALHTFFSDGEYSDFSFADAQRQFPSLNEVIVELQVISDRFYRAPNEFTGAVHHCIDASGQTEVPLLAVSLRGDEGILEVSTNVSTSLETTLSSILQGRSSMLSTMHLSFRLGVRGKGFLETWKGDWHGVVDPHHSTMTARFSFSLKDDDFNLIAFGSRLVVAFAALLVLVRCLQTKLFGVVVCIHLGSNLLAASASLQTRIVSFDACHSAVRLTSGVACFASLAFVALSSLPKRFPSFCEVRHSFVVAAPHLWWYMVGVLPVFVGFTIGGVALFASADIDHFKNIPRSAVTLFCSIFGDSLIDIFTSMDENEKNTIWYAQSRIFFVGFLFLFITTVLNVGLSVVQESHAVGKFMSSSSRSTDETLSEFESEALVKLLNVQLRAVEVS